MSNFYSHACRSAAALFCTFVLFGPAPALLAAEENAGPQPASPDEINAGLQLYAGYLLSNDGAWIAFSTTMGEGLANLGSSQKFNTGPGWSVVGASSWSPLKPVVAMRVHREGKGALTLWTAGTPVTETSELLVFPRKLYPQMPAVWTADARTLFFVIHQNLPWAKSHPDDDNRPTSNVNVDLVITRPYLKVRIRQRFEKEYEEAYAETNRSLIMALDLATGRAGVVTKGNDIASIALSPDGRRMAVFQNKRFAPRPPAWTKQPLGDIYVIDVPQDLSQTPTIDLEAMEDRKAGWSDHTGKRLYPLEKDAQLMPGGLVWSPDSQSLAYATVGNGSTGDVFVYDMATQSRRNLTEKVAVARRGKSLGYGDNRTHPYDSPKFGDGRNPPLWTPDGRNLLVIGGDDLWAVPLDPKQTARDLSVKLPLEARRVVPSVQRNIAAVDADGRVVLVAKERLSRLDSIFKFNLRNNETTKLADAGVWVNGSPSTDKQGKQIFYTGQDDRSATNVQRLALDGNASPEYFTTYKLELVQRAYPESRVLSWKTSDAYPGFGLLYLPAGASASNKAPLVVLTDSAGDDNSQLDVRSIYGAKYYSDALHRMLRAGFAVLQTDVAMSDEGVYESPMKQAVEGVKLAADAAVATGVIDESRLGIMGAYYGGFIVQAAIARSDRFKAAVSMSGTGNWSDDYLGPMGPNFHERGGGRLAKALWEEPQRYVENSPITYWNQVHTPLLLIHGVNDYIPIAYSDEAFKGLQRLDQVAILARYNQGIPVESNRRAIGWFREHLMGGEQITQVADQGSFMFGGDMEGEDSTIKP